MLAEAIYHSPARLQLSVPRFGARNTERGANLDSATVGLPLSDLPALLSRVDAALALNMERPGEPPSSPQRTQRNRVYVHTKATGTVILTMTTWGCLVALRAWCAVFLTRRTLCPSAGRT